MANYVFPFAGEEDLESVFSFDTILPFHFYRDLRSNLLPSRNSLGSHDVLSNISSELDQIYFDDRNSCEYFENLILQRSKHNFSILGCNINSFLKNFENFKTSYLDNDLAFKPSILGFCESKLDINTQQLCSIPNYELVFNSRNTRGGGVMLAIKTEINFERVDELTVSENFLESLFVKLKIKNSILFIGIIYRRPGANHEQFISEYSRILQYIGNRKCVLFGDYNYDLIKYSESGCVRNFVDLSFENGLLPLIDKPTRISRSSATCIDHFWTNDYCEIDRGILMSNSSDHFAPFILFDFEEISPSAKVFKYRNWNAASTNEFKSTLERNLNLISVNSDDDPNLALDGFLGALNTAIDQHCPIKTKFESNKKKCNAWCTPELKNLIKEKNRIFSKYLRYPITYGTSYRQIRNRVNNMIKYQKKYYILNQLRMFKSDTKKKWSVINEILNRNTRKSMGEIKVDGSLTGDEVKISNSFNDYFSKIPGDIKSKMPVPNVSYENFLTGSYSSSFFLRPMSMSDLVELIGELKDSSGGYLGIPAKVFKDNLDIICDPLCRIYNLCISKGYFPKKLKIAKITPIFKAGDRSEVSNYRPISVLSPLSKLLEKYIHSQISSYFETKNIFNNQQCGFRNRRSTDLSIAKLLKMIIEGVDEGKYGVSVFLDFKKAFDLVDHDILIKKLSFYGIRGVSIDLISSFLKDRYQYVEVNGISSDLSRVSLGVVQGSILGSLLFIIFINDIVNSSRILKFNLYADDTSIYYANHSLDITYEVLNRELLSVSNWIVANGLSLNSNKTYYMLFAGKKPIMNVPSLILSDNRVTKIKEFKFLGVLLDDAISWRSQALAVANRVSRFIGIFAKIRNNLTLEASKLIYYSFVQCILTYGVVFWQAAPKTIIDRVSRLTKRAIRIVTLSPRLAHSEPLFKNCNILKFEDLCSLETGKFVHRDLIFGNHLELETHSAQHNYPTRTRNHLVRAQTRTNVAFKFITSSGVSLYNSIPDYCKNCEDVAKFKILYKKSLLDNYSR